MSGQKGWNRREFVQLMGYSTLSSAGLCSSLLPSALTSGRVKFAYVGCMGERDAIEVFAVRGGEWRAIQRVESERPVSLALDASRRFLYVTNEIDVHEGLPSGSVEAFAIGADGRLTRLNRQRLALSATKPRHIAVAPDGKSVVVTVRGGGAYNVLPIEEDGRLGRVSGILKETGWEREGASSPARPEMVVFDKAGRVVSVDGGADRLSVFAVGQGGIRAHTRTALEAGSRAQQVAMHPDEKMLYVLDAESLACYGYDAPTGRILEKRHSLPAAGVGSLAVHPSGALLYGCQGRGVSAWRVDAATGSLRMVGRHAEELGRLDAIDVSPDGRTMVMVNRERGAVCGAQVDGGTGRVSSSVELARVESPRSLAVIYS